MKPRRMVCFDTGPLIWGIQQRAHSSQQVMVDRTRRYIQHLSEENKRIMIPAPVMAEYLAGFSDEVERETQAQLLQKVFFIASFDVKAAQIAAEIESNRTLVKQVRDEHRLNNAQISTDIQIISIAVANSAEVIVAQDGQFEKLSQGRIIVIDVPSISEQLPLFRSAQNSN